MKKILFLGLLTGFIQCRSHSTVKPDNILTGRWVWIQSTGGIAGTTSTPASTHQTIEIEFTADSHQRVYLNGQLASDMGFKTVKSKSIYKGEEAGMIQYDVDNVKKSYSFDNGSLILADECYDCFTSQYSRKNTGNE